MNQDQAPTGASPDHAALAAPALPERSHRRVYLSSTYQDLVGFRRKVDEALRQLGYHVVAMEAYVAADARPVDQCVADVRASDVYVGVFAWRYGFVPPGHDRSITELEYEEAGRVGRERLIFMTKEDASWPQNQIDWGAGRERIQNLRAQLALDHMVGFFSTPDDLATKVATAITRWADRQLTAEVDRLRTEQARADPERRRSEQRVVNPPPVGVSRFLDRQTQRRSLLDFLTENSIRMVSVVGRAGMGKSALACWVLTNLEADRSRSSWAPEPSAPDGILYLSAHGTGLSLERLYADLRRMLPAEQADILAEAWASQDATLSQKVGTLLDAMGDRRYLILLDGVETVLSDDGGIVDDGLRAFVEACLRRSEAPVLILTSRAHFLVPPEALGDVRIVRVSQGLGPEDAVALLRSLDPQGELGLQDAPAAELERAAELTGGIPRALEVLAGIMQRDPAATLRTLLEDERAFGSQTVQGLVAEGYRRLGASERRVMEALAVLERPAPSTALSYLLHPWFPGIDVSGCLQRLVRSYFVTSNRRTGEFSLQPLDHEHAYSQIPDAGDVAGTAAHGYSRQDLELRAADFYASIRKPPEQWLSIDDLDPQLAEFQHSVRGGDVDRALKVLESVDRDYLSLWGNYNRLIELRSSVLDAPAQPRLRAANFAGLAICNQVFGQYETAVDYYRQAIALAREAGDRDAETQYVGSLGRVYRNLGEIDKAVDYTQQALDHALERADRRSEGVWSDKLGLAYWNLGRLDEAAELITRATGIAHEVGDSRTEAAALSNRGLIYQTLGHDELAKSNFETSLAMIREIRDGRGEAIVLGRMGTVALAVGDPAHALELHEQALSVAVALGERREQSYQLIGFGAALNMQGDPAQAEERFRAACDLDVPETAYMAALGLGVALFRSGRRAAADEAFGDAIRRCHERLQRCNRLYRVRYSLAIALTGAAVCATEWDEEPRRAALLAPAVAECRQAIAICPGHGVVKAALQQLAQLATTDVSGLEPVIVLLRGTLAEQQTPDRAGDGR
jgi:tetratricopeptide (TPR) repeat protein